MDGLLALEGLFRMLGIAGAVTKAPPFLSKNLLLNALPLVEARWLIDSSIPVDFSARTVVQAPDSLITHCYFVEAGVLSMVSVLEDGGSQEVGIVGNEGFIGLPVLFGADRSPIEVNVQLAGCGLQIEATVMKAAFENSAATRRIMLQFAQAMNVQISQTAVCNSQHETEQRLARWLLMADDKYGVRPMPLTQEFLSMMLGVRRQQVSISAAVLQQKGLIQYQSGNIEITDRTGLEAAACECYGIVAREYERLLD